GEVGAGGSGGREGRGGGRQDRVVYAPGSPGLPHTHGLIPGRIPIMVATATPTTSMNAASEKDPFNNNCYGTIVDRPYKPVSLPVLDVLDFNERIIRGYEEGKGEGDLPADLSCATSSRREVTAALTA